MNRMIVLSLFAALVFVQLAVPTGMILRREAALRNGQEFKIRVQPVDPYDAFRGRYVQLGFNVTAAALPAGVQLTRPRSVYAVLETDPSGYAAVKSISLTTPSGAAYLSVRVFPYSSGSARVVWPFDRYYMEENAAPEAERVYRERVQKSEAYITVRVANGTGVITGLYIDGKPIEEMLRNR